MTIYLGGAYNHIGRKFNLNNLLTQSINWIIIFKRFLFCMHLIKLIRYKSNSKIEWHSYECHHYSKNQKGHSQTHLMHFLWGCKKCLLFNFITWLWLVKKTNNFECNLLFTLLLHGYVIAFYFGFCHTPGCLFIGHWINIFAFKST